MNRGLVALMRSSAHKDQPTVGRETLRELAHQSKELVWLSTFETPIRKVVAFVNHQHIPRAPPSIICLAFSPENCLVNARNDDPIRCYSGIR